MKGRVGGPRDWGKRAGLLAVLDEDKREYHLNLPEESCKLM